MIKRVCKDCKKEFTLSDSEIKFFKDKNLELPKRCSECRGKKRENSYDEAQKRESRVKTNSRGNAIRNIIIAAVVIIASFFGIKLNFFQDNSVGYTGNKTVVNQDYSITFRNNQSLKEHFEKHGEEFDYDNEQQYLQGAISVINSSSSLHKIESEDGEEIYYDKEKNEIVFVSKDGYIRTYFKPSDGINYYNRQ